MLVLARSNGTSVITVNLAPHSVQLVNGNKCLLSRGFVKSLAHAAHRAVSVGMSETLLPSLLSTMEKPSWRSSVSSYSTRSILASAGSASFSRLTNSSWSRSTWTSTFEPLFRTYPFSPICAATLYTVGRKPTPCTIPNIDIFICAPLTAPSLPPARRAPFRDGRPS